MVPTFPIEGCAQIIAISMSGYMFVLSVHLLISILLQLLEKDVSIRLGCLEAPEGDIYYHPFFNGINWDKLDRRELVPPFKPEVVSHFPILLKDVSKSVN